MTVRFSPEIIGDLRRLAVDHNGVAEPQFHVKLNKLKKLYGSFLSAGGHSQALVKIEGHLRGLRDGLSKARRPPRGRRGEPFDPAEHPRGRGGQFASTGGGHAIQVTGSVNAPVTVGQGHPIQVIPETRYSVFGPPIAGAAGVAAGAIAGAGASTLTQGPLDRLTTAGVRRISGVAGHFAGGAVGAGIAGARHLGRAASRSIRQTTGVQVPTPGPYVPGQREAARRIGRRAGQLVGEGVGRGIAAASNAPAHAAHRVVGLLGGGRVARGSAGALIGGAITGGMVYAPALYHSMQFLGPYLDARYPRRVRKADGSEVSEAEVLAKVDELWDDEELAKASAIGLVARALGRHGIDAVRLAVAPAIGGARRLGGRAVSRLRPRGFVPPVPPVGPPVHPSAVHVFGAGDTEALKPRGRGRLISVLSHAVPLGAVGAGVGAISGASLAHFNLVHPRDPRGRFTHKGQVATLGAKIGAAAGAGLGIATGLIAAREGHTAALRAAIQRLGAGAEQMRAATVKHAQEAHASAFADRNRGIKSNLNLSPGELPSRQRVVTEIETAATRQFLERPIAQAMANAEVWYRHQIGQAFDAEAKRALGASLKDINGRTIPQNGRNLILNVDRSKIRGKRKLAIWDDLVKRHEMSVEALDQQIVGRKVAIDTADATHNVLQAERTELSGNLARVTRLMKELDKPSSTLTQIRQFAKDELGITRLRGASREDALDELRRVHGQWVSGVQERLDALPSAIREANQAHAFAVEHAKDPDLSQAEREAVPNLFVTKGQKAFYPSLPDVDVEAKKFAQRASKPFIEESDRTTQAAVDHLHHLIAAQQVAHEMQIPERGLLSRAAHRYMPVLSTWVSGAMGDYNYLMNARRTTLTGWRKNVSDYLRTSTADTTAMLEAAKRLGRFGKRHADQATGFAFTHYRAIGSALGLLGAVGAVEIAQKDGKRTIRKKIDPRKWKLPAGFRVEKESFVNLQGRLGHAVFGFSYKDDKGEQRFLQGWHITGPGPNDRQSIPYGTPVSSIVSQAQQIVRGGKGGGAGKVDLPDDVVKKTEDLERGGRIATVGEPGFEYQERSKGGDGEREAQTAQNAFFKQHLAWNQHGSKRRSTNRPDRYWDALSALFDPNMAILDQDRRLQLLIGTPKRGNEPEKNGIFANRGDVYFGNDPDKIRAELIHQIHSEQGDVLRPTEQAHVDAMTRAVNLIASVKNLSATQKAMVIGRLHEDLGGGQRFTTPRQSTAFVPQGMTENAREAADDWVRANPNRKRHKDDDAARDLLVSLYEQGWNNSVANSAASTPESVHRAAGEEAMREGSAVWKAEPTGGLRKYLSNEPAAPRRPRAPRIGGSAAPKQPSYLRQEAHPARALSQIGSYGLGQAGYASAKYLAHTMLPGGGTIPKIARFGMESLGGIGGGGAGQVYGQRLGQKIAGSAGPRMSEKEQTVRAIGGVAGTVGGTALGERAGVQRAINRVASAASRRVASSAGGMAIRGAAARLGRTAVGTATKGIAQRIGSAIGGWVGRGAGAAAGTAAEPGGGTIAGGLAGYAAGQAIGAGVGYLADEGIGLLYHHLSRYGSHVPHMAAKSLGHTPRVAQASRQQNPKMPGFRQQATA